MFLAELHCGRVAGLGASRQEEGLGRVVAVVNQKGGVGKTTTSINLAAALAMTGRPTLLVDADPQANSTRALGFPADPDRPSIYDALSGGTHADQIRVGYPPVPHLSLVPSDTDLVGMEVELVEADEREYRLKRFLEGERELFDHVVIDCPPSLGLITINALVAADAVLVPVQAEYLALEGVSQLMQTIERVREALNPGLAIAGVLITMYDDRTNLARQVVEDVRSVFGDQVFRTIVPRSVRLGEAPSHGQPIFLYDGRSRGAEAYRRLTEEYLSHEEKGAGQGAEQPHPARTSEASAGGSLPDAVAGGSEGAGAAADRRRSDLA